MKGRNLTSGQPDGIKGRTKGASRGGLAVKNLKPPDTCPKCGRDMSTRSWHSYIGHLGLHSTADRHFGGDTVAALRYALAQQDPVPGNNAWQQWNKKESLNDE